MSIEAMSWALNAPLGGTEKLVLLGLANHAHHDGTECWPSVETLAKYAHCDRRTVQRTLRKLVAGGWAAEAGEGPKKTVKYELPVGRQIAAPADCHPDTPVLEGGGTTVLGGAAPMPPEPSIEPSKGTVPTGSVADAPGAAEAIREIHAVYAHFLSVTGRPSDTTLTRSQSRLISKALSDGNSVAILQRAFDGLVEWRKRKPGDTTLSAVLATRPGGSALSDQIEFFASHAPGGLVGSEAPAIPVDVSDSIRGTLRTHLQRLIAGWKQADDPDRVAAARETVLRLRERGFDVVREPDGRPRIVHKAEGEAQA